MVSVRRFLGFALVLILLFQSACKSKPQDRGDAEVSTNDSLRVLCLQTFISSGLSGSFVPDFEKKSGIKVSFTTAQNSTELLETLQAESVKYDLVVGLDNASVAAQDINHLFAKSASYEDLKTDILIDRSMKLTPYAYGYLCLIYNPAQIQDPPESFGELQDPKFYNQLAIADPGEGGLSAAVLHWTIALFGEQGYEYLWRSLRKNIVRVYDHWDETLSALVDGSCSMIIGLSSTPSWYQEREPNAAPLRTSMLREGSYLYVEYAAVMEQSESKASAERFIQALLDPVTQQIQIYKLGLFPANTKTFIPMHFAGLHLQCWSYL
jgi:ABC transporter substrate-binding protein (ThiB subfamily)